VNKFFKKSRSYLKILGSRKVPRSQFHTAKSSVAMATWRPGYLHSHITSSSTVVSPPV